MAISIPWSRWLSDNRSQEPLHLVRHSYPVGVGWGRHRHDFAEVFWCESGSGIHVVNGREFVLRSGDVVCIRPEDVHTSRAGKDGLAIVNASFLPRSIAGLASRHRSGWPWRAGPDPLHVHLPPSRMERLHAWTVELARREPRRLDLECFLLDLARLVAEPAETGVDERLPPWLHEALGIFSDPRHLGGGVPRLAHLAGRSVAHVNRVLRRCTGRSATDLVTDLRLERAAAELRLGQRTVADIATAIGLPNLGYFYQRFQARFGTTPRRYRQAARQAVT